MKRKTLVLLTIISFLLLATLGVSVAIFSAIKNGSGLVSIRSGDINFKYTEVSGIGNGINLDISDVISDSEGKVLDNYFDFKIESNLIGSDMVYEVSIEPLINTTINLSGLKIYITELVDGGEREISSNFNGLGKVKYLTDYENYVIYQERIIKNTKNYEKNFRVRMWIGEDVNIYTNEYMGTSGSFRVNVNSKSDYSMVDASIPTPVITGGTGMIWTTELQTISLVPTTPAIGGVTYEYYVADDSDDIPNDLTIATGTTMDSYNVIRIGQNYIYYRAVTSDNLKSSWSNPEIVYYDNTEYSITYVLNGGTLGEDAVTSYNVETPSFDLLEPTYQGYVFEGWHTTSDFTGSVVTRINKGSRGNKVFYAKWSVIQSIVTLDNQSATTEGTTSVIATYGSAMPSITIPIRIGYTFEGYYTEANGSGIKYINSDGTSARNWDKNTDTTLYASWVEGYLPGLYDNNFNLLKSWSELEKLGMTKGSIEADYTYSSYRESGSNSAYDIFTSNNLNGILVLPNTITKVGQYSFYRVTGLTKLILSSGVTSIGNHNFEYCTNLTSVTLPTTVNTIGYFAFQENSKLTSINIPESVTSIGTYAFSNCTSLASINIPKSVTNIGGNAFSGDSKLTSIVVDTNNLNYSSSNGILYDKNKTTLVAYPSASGNITIPSTVKKIGNSSFTSNSNIRSVSIGTSVTEIGANSFMFCSKLESVTIGSNVKSIGAYAFSNCSKLTSVTFGATSGWYVAQSSNASSGTSIAVTNASTNASNLSNTYSTYYWRRN